MTCSIGLCSRGAVYIGTDSSTVGDEGSLEVYHHRKCFWNGPFLFAYAGSFRFGQRLEFAFSPPTHSVTRPFLLQRNYNSDLHYLTTDFVNAVMSLEMDSEEWELIFAYRRKLYTLQADYSILPHSTFCAIGNGADIALGSLYSTSSIPSPEARIRKALAAASQLNPFVTWPFYVEVQCEDSPQQNGSLEPST